MEGSRHLEPHAIHPDMVEWAIAEIDAAIELVSSGLAVSVRLCELPEIDLAAAPGLAHAQARGVPFRFVRDGDTDPYIVIGPLGPAETAAVRS
jgi:hypothetical protein